MPNYFQILAVDELENILRSVSKRPNRLDWHAFVDPEDLINVFHSNNLLSTPAFSLFTSVTGGKYSHYDHCGFWPPCNCLSTCSTANVFAADYFPEVMKYCGATAKHLAFSQEQDLTPSSANAVVAYGKALESLSMYSTFAVNEFDLILQHRGRQLRKLHINCIRSEIATSISNYCTSLSQLTLIDGQNNFPLIFNAVGTTLKSLEVKNSLDHVAFNLIRNTCPQLRNLRLWCVPQNYDCLVNLCRFYGPQLDFVWIHHFSVSQCRRLIEVCPNVRVEMDINSDVVDTLIVLSKHAQTLSVSFENYIDKSRLANALAQCTSLRRLHLYGMDQADDDILLKLFKISNCLQLHELSFQPNIEVRPNEISAFAAATGQLRILKLTVDCAELQPQALEVLLAQNPYLERVKIMLLNFEPFERGGADDDEQDGIEGNADDVSNDDSLQVPDNDGEWFLFQLLRVFSAAKMLRELVVVPFPEVRSCWDYLYCVEDACIEFGLRFRRIHVSVLNVDYLPVMDELAQENNQQDWHDLEFEHHSSFDDYDEYDGDGFWPSDDEMFLVH